jgi:hypothetical protein
MILLFSGNAEAQSTSVVSTSHNYETIYDKLIKLSADPNQVASVNSLTIQRDVAKFNLIKGDLYLCQPIAGRVCAAVFMGEGSFEYIPPTEIEREQLSRFLGKRELNEKFHSLFFLFTDTTLDEFQKKMKFTPRKVASKIQSNIEDCLEYLSNPEGKYFDDDIMLTLLENQTNDLFYAHIDFDDIEPLIFKINPYNDEEISLLRRADGMYWEHDPETINQFHKQEYYGSTSYNTSQHKRLLDIYSYIIDFAIDDDLDISLNAEIGFKLIEENRKWINFYLYPELIVDSVFWEDGRKAQFFSKEKNPYFWIYCDPPLEKEHMYKFKMYYHGTILKRHDQFNWIIIKSSTGWYPHHGFRAKATFDITFHTPSKYRIVSVGDNIFSKTDDDVLTTRWVCKRPIRNASFNIGYYESFKIDNDKIPPVEILFSESGHHEIGAALISEGILSGSDMEKQVGIDVENSFLYYQNLFGRCLADQFSATEISGLHGEAFPGLIHLSWATFQFNNNEGENEIFRAHEVAHQWWGIGVDVKSYHDLWLGEGFAQYSGLMYMQVILKNNKKFFNKLNEWKDQILSNRKYLLGSGQEAGPVWLGYRTQGSTTEGDYNLIIYKKGAWILHMLRNMMIDLKTMDETRFKSMLQEYYSSYLDKYASTEDFQRIVEKYMGIDMSWFFQQWVYDTKIPEYKFSYKVEGLPQSKCKVIMRVQQQRVSENFQMPIPIFIDFGENRFARIRIMAKGPVSEIELPILPLRPEKIIFNDLSSVLCESEEIDWD